MPISTPLVVLTVKTAFPKAELSIPYIAKGSNPQAVKIMNDTIMSHVKRLVSSQGSLEDPKAEMLGYYELKTNEKGVFSLSLYNYAFTGGAHGMTLQQSLTFMTDTGALFELEQLFKPGSDYMARISKIVAAQIEERGIETLEPFKQISEQQSFYVADRSLVIYFQLYELAAYVYGFIYFPISVYALQDIIAEESPLGVMLAGD
ncbi:DUF3298 and DUF4163 domain-containing protein [Paenibacillus sp. HB172176]|uniref:DUF3298 and DUF4163 domain-containing protein n=1 Tax=Paenibacillus sp. HB172176 TaxID=2493690 RepID=UPI00143A43A6|nr:DUF3298 and DUF4163 domain-containing protein [Paenibacillus sp. HB172176]